MYLIKVCLSGELRGSRFDDALDGVRAERKPTTRLINTLMTPISFHFQVIYY